MQDQQYTHKETDQEAAINLYLHVNLILLARVGIINIPAWRKTVHKGIVTATPKTLWPHIASHKFPDSCKMMQPLSNRAQHNGTLETGPIADIMLQVIAQDYTSLKNDACKPDAPTI